MVNRIKELELLKGGFHDKDFQKSTNLIAN